MGRNHRRRSSTKSSGCNSSEDSGIMDQHKKSPDPVEVPVNRIKMNGGTPRSDSDLCCNRNANKNGRSKWSSGTLQKKVIREDPDCHPLLIPRVISMLFPYFDIHSLKAARGVCKDWKSASTDLILTKGVAHLDGVTHSNRYDMDNFLQSMEQNGTRRYSRFNLTRARYDSPFRSLFTIYGHHVKSLTLDCYDGEQNYFTVNFLDRVLQTCPNLEEIDIYCPTDDFRNPNTNLTRDECKLRKITLRAETGIHADFVQDFINACPNLKSFTVLKFDEMRNTDFVCNLFQLGEVGKIDLSKLEWLDIGGTTSVLTTSSAMASLARQSLNLTFLEITLHVEMVSGPAILQQMLEHLRRTLRCFILSNYPGTVSTKFPIIIPSTMTKLEKLEIRTGTNQFFMGPLASAVHLPRLKTFIMHRTPFLEFQHIAVPGVHYDFQMCWSLLENSWFANRCTTLETLQLPCGFNTSFHLYNISLVFPNLRDLRLQNPSEEIISLVFLCCQQLESLSFRLKMYPMTIDSLITGLPYWTCARMMSSEPKQFDIWPIDLGQRKPGLWNMKSLKYFELRQWEDVVSLTDVTLWHGLIHLKRALRLDVNGCESIDPESIEYLKTILGPACYVNIASENPGDKKMDYTNFWARDGFSDDKKF